MTGQDVADWARAHKNVTMFWYVATQDYAAARCCLLNGIFSGFAVAEQAVEKYLKGFLFSHGKKRIGGHDLPRLLSCAATGVPELTEFTSLVETLARAYANRYPGGAGVGRLSTADIVPLDKMTVLLWERVPIPDEVKFRMEPFASIFDDRHRVHWRNGDWLLWQNTAVLPKLEHWRQRYEQVLDHLHPNRE